MNTTVNSLIKQAIEQEARLHLTIEAINTIDRFALGRGPSGRLLGVMAYGHLSGIRKALNTGLANSTTIDSTAQAEFDFGIADEPTPPADNNKLLEAVVALQDNEAALVQKGQVYKTTLPALTGKVSDYLKEKVEKHPAAAADAESFLDKYVGRFFRHLSRRFGKKA